MAGEGEGSFICDFRYNKWPALRSPVKTNVSLSEREKWERIRADGYLRFLVLNGLVLTNLTITSSAVIGMIVAHELFHLSGPLLSEGRTKLWLWCLVVVSVCGLLRANWDWLKNEKKFANDESRR